MDFLALGVSRRRAKENPEKRGAFSPDFLPRANLGKTWFKKAFLCQTFLGRVLREQSGFSLGLGIPRMPSGKGVFSPHFLPRPFELKTLKLLRPWEQGFSAQI